MTGSEIRELVKNELKDIPSKFDEPMSGHTSLRIGGPADVMLWPGSAEDLARVVEFSRAKELGLTALGGGTNVLVSDLGVEGAVLSVAALDRLEVIEETGSEAMVEAGAGVGLRRLLGFCAKRGLSGLEGLAGIPGQVGGAVAGNAGSFGCEVKDAVSEVTLVDGASNWITVGSRDAGFGYRTSALQERGVISSVRFKFRRESPEAVVRRIREFLRMKKASQPLGAWSAGCVFKNPLGKAAAALIEASGCKAMRAGDIEVSSLHAGFFVNTGKGRSEDFIRLMKKVTERVVRAFGVELEPEIRMFGRGL